MTEEGGESSPPESGLGATEEVLLAAAELSSFKSGVEFTEWALTVKAWQLNPKRWGMPGFEDSYPDHKRVMNELMAGDSRRVIPRGWLERTRTNHYRLTPSGLARATTLKPSERTGTPRDLAAYDAVEPFAFHRVFESFLGNESEPKIWLGAAAFLGLTRNDASLLEQRLNTIRSAIDNANQFMAESGIDVLRRGAAGKAITKERLKKLEEFVEVIQVRFATQLGAIRRR